jgi:hypothetical protein
VPPFVKEGDTTHKKEVIVTEFSQFSHLFPSRIHRGKHVQGTAVSPEIEKKQAKERRLARKRQRQARKITGRNRK